VTVEENEDVSVGSLGLAQALRTLNPAPSTDALYYRM
jgi:hypothetical protein